MHIAIDIGGTFTDVVASGPEGISAIKVPSSRDDPVAAVEAGIAAAQDHGRDAVLFRVQGQSGSRFVGVPFERG